MTPAAVALDSVEDWIMNGHEDETMDEYFARLAEAARFAVVPLRGQRVFHGATNGIAFQNSANTRDLRV